MPANITPMWATLKSLSFCPSTILEQPWTWDPLKDVAHRSPLRTTLFIQLSWHAPQSKPSVTTAVDYFLFVGLYRTRYHTTNCTSVLLRMCSWTLLFARYWVFIILAVTRREVKPHVDKFALLNFCGRNARAPTANLLGLTRDLYRLDRSNSQRHYY